MNMIDGMRGQLLSGASEAVWWGAMHWWMRAAAGCVVQGCTAADDNHPRLLPLALTHPSSPCVCTAAAELTSRGFVQSLEGSSANAQRSDLVRAVLVSRHWVD